MSLWPVCNGPASRRGRVSEGHPAAFQRGVRDGLIVGLGVGLVLVSLLLVWLWL